jgi:tRNA (cmo5U34)-methyltransferase
MDVSQKYHGFDSLAWMYDTLAQLVFGRSIKEAQRYHLNDITDGTTVLILGGGTGWLLHDLLLLKPDCRVWYIDASAKMIEAAKKKVPLNHDVHFIVGTEEFIPRDMKFDVILTPFYLDMFTDTCLQRIIGLIKEVQGSSGVWIITDFVHTGKWWHEVLLAQMYFFFRWVAGIEAVRLPHWQRLIANSGYKELNTRFFYSGFIKAGFYKRDC